MLGSAILLSQMTYGGLGSSTRCTTARAHSKFAGTGKEEETVWACFDCARCLCQQCPEITPQAFALANWMGLGRVHHIFRDLTFVMRLLLGLGRPAMRSLYLGRGPQGEVHRGLHGNAMIVAQPSATYKRVVPDVNHVLSGINICFAKW